MKRSVILLLTFISLTASAQYISPFFATMPNYLLPYLSQNNRKDLIDLQRSGKSPQVENLLKGTTSLKILKDDFIALQLSESSEAELKLLPTSDTTKIIAFIKTDCGKACDSRISFFSTTWQTIDSKGILPKITVSDFIKNPSNEDLVRAVDFSFIFFSFDPDKQQLVAKLDARNWLNKADYEKFSPDLLSSIVLKWSNGKFVKE